MKNNRQIKNRIVDFKRYTSKNFNRMNESSQEPGGKDAYISVKIICDYATKLKEMLTQDTEVENWVIKKLAVCQETMDEIFHYMDGMQELDGDDSAPMG